MKKISADASISGNASPVTVPFTAYLAAKGFLEDLLAELGDEVIEVRGRLVLAKGAPRPAAWAQNTWETPVFLPIESIGDGARKLTDRKSTRLNSSQTCALPICELACAV